MRLLLGFLGLACLVTPTLAARRGRSPAPPRRTGAVVVEDFGGGVGRWVTDDDGAAGTGPATKCAIYAMSGGPPGGGDRSARVEFQEAISGWASVSLPVDGARWAARHCSKLSLWVRGDGSGAAVHIILRVRTAEPARDVGYAQTIKLDSTDWENYSLRFFGFHDPGGAALAPEDVAQIKLLQFSQSGQWGHFRFRVADITAESEPGAAAPARPAPPVGGKTVVLTPDFGKAGVQALTQFCFGLRGAPSILDGGDKGGLVWATAAASDLGPCAIRLNLADYWEPRREAYDLERLARHLAWVRQGNCRPLICLNPPQASTADEERKTRVFSAFVGAVSELVKTQAQEPAGVYYELFNDPLVAGGFEDVPHLVTAYNKLAELILATDPNAHVGGPGFSSPWDDRLEGFLRGAESLDFLSFHFYGTHNLQTDAQTLFDTACASRAEDIPHQVALARVARLVKTLRTKPAEIYVTELALDASRDERGRARDQRVEGPFGAAWLAAAVLSAAPWVDKVFLYRLAGGGWGMIGDDGKPTPLYWTAWLLKHYAPRGAERLEVLRLGPLTLAATVRTRTALNLIVAHAGAEPLALAVEPQNLPPLGQVRERHLGGEKGWTGSYLPRTGAQNLQLAGPGVLVVQYIPGGQP